MKTTFYIVLLALMLPVMTKAQSISGTLTGVCPDETYTYNVNMGSYCNSVTALSCNGCYDKVVSSNKSTITLKWSPGNVSRNVTATLMCTEPDDPIHGDRELPNNISSNVTLAQSKIPLFVCEDETFTEYIAQDKPIPASDSRCSDTNIRVTLTRDPDYPNNFTFKGYPFDRSQTTDNTGIKVEKVSTSQGTRSKLTLYWADGWKGNIKVSIEYEKRQWDVTDIFGKCETDPWKELVSYVFVREGNPQGQLSGSSTVILSGPEATINLGYVKQSGYLGNVLGVRYSINGEQIAEKLSCSGNSSFSLSHKTAIVGPTTFTTQIQDQCGRWWIGPSKTVTVLPSCYLDNPTDIETNITGTPLEPFPEGFQITKDVAYTLSIYGVTNFDANYEVSFENAGGDLTVSDKTFTALKGIGKYQIDFIKRNGRASCPDIKPVVIFLNGKDETLEEELGCPITLPDDFAKFGFPNIDLTNIILQHFAALVKSKSSITIKPGITLSLGAELILDREPNVPLPPSPDLDLNFIETTSYNEYNQVLSKTRNYYDENARLMQSQFKNISNGVMMATAALYDAQGRKVITTLPAPVDVVKVEVNVCANVPVVTEDTQFGFKANFVQSSDGISYKSTHFDLVKEQNPDPIKNTDPGTLGWYYSANNGNAPEEKKAMNEDFVATTAYPYSRTLYHHDGSGEVEATTKPGDVFRAGGGHTGSFKSEPVAATDPYLSKYLAMRAEIFPLQAPVAEGQFYRTVSVDANERKIITYFDKSGKTVIGLYFGKQSAAITKNYTFYDDADRMIISVAPNGVNQFEKDVPTPFSQVEKTQYFYNLKGFLTAIEEPDAGRTEYQHRKDGKIRFSQNTEQRKTGRYSYTHYDRLGRTIESGEYQPGLITFGSREMKNILETIMPGGGLPSVRENLIDQKVTVYDIVDVEIPGGRSQRFVSGAVSKTHKDNLITTWFSYDEQSRVEWLVQDIKNLGVKNIDYRYSAFGAIQEITYQKDNDTERFTHFYEYDKSGRIFRVFTTQTRLSYNKEGELLNGVTYDAAGRIVNPGPLQLQATYEYYLHGPLKRIEYANGVQGIDYLYTPDGSIKSINDGGKSQDPGSDDNDVFGITFDYYNGDYESVDFSAGTVSYPDGTTDQFNGNLKGAKWHSPIESSQVSAYGYRYDERDQFKDARWGDTKTGMMSFSANAYLESVNSYDANGNIQNLVRNNSKGNAIADFQYHYILNTNKIDNITKGTEVILDYHYNDIGQLIEKEFEGKRVKYAYDVTGKLASIKTMDDHLIALYNYDDRGFRLSKTTYENDVIKLTTWYVRDQIGKVLSIYEQSAGASQASPVDMPVYGRDRVGVFKNQFGLTFYEVKDHLGNVRAVIGDDVSTEYMATMESERADVEQCAECPFINLKTGPAPTYLNHTPPSITVDNVTESIADPNEAVRVSNAGSDKNPIGGGIILPVYPGDKISAEVFAKYQSFEDGNATAITGIAAYLATAFTLPRSIIDGVNIFNGLDQAPAGVFDALKNINNTMPKAFLTYIVFDNNFVPVKFNYDQVSSAAKVPGLGEGDPMLHPHERLFFDDLLIEKEGFIYIYVSNQSDQGVEVFFDDLKVKHEYSDIVAGADYYPLGMEINDRKITRESYRYGYQGNFSEKDLTTGMTHFELRDYDPVIGRWILPDPKRSGFSPYIGMENNPVIKVDPDGGCVPNCPPGFQNSSTMNLIRAYKPSITPHTNFTIGVGEGSRGRLGSYDGTKGDLGGDFVHGMYSFGTDGQNFQFTAGGGAYKAQHSDVQTGIEGYAFRANLGYKGNEYDFFGFEGGFFGPGHSTRGFIDNDPPTIIDLGIMEVGYESNYGLYDLTMDFIEGTRDYVKSMITVDDWFTDFDGGN